MASRVGMIDTVDVANENARLHVGHVKQFEAHRFTPCACCGVITKVFYVTFVHTNAHHHGCVPIYM